MTNELDKKETAIVEPTMEYDLENDELNIGKYLQPKWKQSKFWLWVILGVIFTLMAIIFKTCVVDKTISPKDLVAAIKIFNVTSQWVESEKIDTPDFKGIILVPEITFQVRNMGNVDLSYVYMLGVFSLHNSPKSLGEGAEMVFKEPLKPGAVSAPITLRCQFGYRATSKKAFVKNAKEWKNCVLKILVKSGTSNYSSLKEIYYISRKIQGLDIEVKVTGDSLNDINPQLGQPNPTGAPK